MLHWALLHCAVTWQSCAVVWCATMPCVLGELCGVLLSCAMIHGTVLDSLGFVLSCALP